MKIIHLSDVHVWRYTWNPRRLASKRLLGIIDLLRGRAGRFRLERFDAVVARALSLAPDHLLITGDLTTTALPAEFADAKRELAPLLADPQKVTVIPGNHDRSTTRSLRARRFEEVFGDFMPGPSFPWLRGLDEQTAILGLDATRSHVSARGELPAAQLEAARVLTANPAARPRRLIVACHYPVAAPDPYQAELEAKRLKNDQAVRDWLAGIGRHLFCCGHVHAAWAFTPPALPDQLCLNAGAPLMRDPTGFRLPGFLEIQLDGPGVTVHHHGWNETEADWLTVPMIQNPHFFEPEPHGDGMPSSRSSPEAASPPPEPSAR